MKANYHTHTPRCRHAVGSEREYIENAIKSGFEILGFSDHSPQFYKNGFVSGMRMTVKEAPEYISTVKKLADEYKNDITVYVGFEAEYFPDIFDSLCRFCRDYGVDYLIMGQHFLRSEQNGIYTGSPCDDKKILTEYVNTVTEGISTGSFSYIAHPDLCNFTGDEEFYREEMTLLCNEAKKCGIPLEINMLGHSTGRSYPSKRFFETAAKVGADTVIGCDAHDPRSLIDTDAQAGVEDFARSLGISPLEKIHLNKI